MNYELSAKPYSFEGASPGYSVSKLGFGAELSGSVSLAPSSDAAPSVVRPQLAKPGDATQEVKKLSIVLPKDVHQQAKLLALTEDTTLTALIIDLLRERIRAARA
jgi:hypothetical protein